MRALISVNAYSAMKTGFHQAFRLREELSNLDVDADICRNEGFRLWISEDGKIINEFGAYDVCVYLDKDKYTARMLEKKGLRLFNSAQAIETCDDKMLTHIALADSGIPMPKTLGGLLCYDQQKRVTRKTVFIVETALGYPVIVKESYGSLGKGVHKADNREELLRLCNELICTPHMFQQFIEESAGRDVRVIVVGGECVAAMLRQSNGDFRSNLELGGTGTEYELDPKLRDICGRTASILGLDYCGIDLLLGKDGYLLCEVNSNAFFGGIERVTNKNIAGAYAEYIVKQMSKK